MTQEEAHSEIGQVNQSLRDLEFKLKQLEEDFVKKEKALKAARKRASDLEAAISELLKRDVISIELYAQGVRMRVSSKLELAEIAEERNKKAAALEGMKTLRDDLEKRCGVLTENLEKASCNVLSF